MGKDKTDKKISRAMKKHHIGQSDGLIVGADGKVYYDKNQDARKNPSQPSGIPSAGGGSGCYDPTPDDDSDNGPVGSIN